MSEPEFFCMFPRCQNLTSDRDALYCKEHARIVEDSVTPKYSIPPSKRSASYGLAISLLAMAASSAAGIGNALYRTLVIIAIAGLIYLIGLRTQ